MTDRSLRFFMAPDEAEQLVAGQGPGELVIDPRPGSLGRFVYLGCAGISDGDISEVESNPGAHAWVRFQLPSLSSGMLHMASLGIRTKWVTHDRPDGDQVMRRVARRFRSRLHRPVWMWSAPADNATIARNVAYSDGARSLFASGCQWRQDGVANVRFGPAPPGS